MPASLTIFFVIEPPGYQYMACHLAASIRMHMPHDVVLIGYCPRQKLDELDRNAVEVLRRLRCQIRPIDTDGQFSSPYPHGNKLLAALDPKDTDFAAFMDSDMLMIRDCDISEITKAGAVGMSPSTSMRWGRNRSGTRSMAILTCRSRKSGLPSPATNAFRLFRILMLV